MESTIKIHKAIDELMVSAETASDEASESLTQVAQGLLNDEISPAVAAQLVHRLIDEAVCALVEEVELLANEVESRAHEFSGDIEEFRREMRKIRALVTREH
jgi:hypothetical protein